MKKITYIIFILLLSLTMNYASAANTLVKAKIDSTLLLMGNQTAVHLEIVQDKGVKGHLLNEGSDTLNSFVEVAERLKADTTDLDNNRIQINRDIIVQSFDSGMYVIPEFKYVVGKDTFSSNTLALKVLPANVDSLTNIHDFKHVASPPFHLLDLIPAYMIDYWWTNLIALVLIVIGVFVYHKWVRKGERPLIKKEKLIPPYDEAIIKLTQLKNEKLWEAGQDKEYFTRLTDILRNYIDRRFDVNAMEMTSAQIMDVLRKNEATLSVNDQLSRVLEMADFVKFAKMRPLPEDNEVAYQRSLNFVNETKPIEIVPEENKENDNNEEKQGEEVNEK